MSLVLEMSLPCNIQMRTQVQLSILIQIFSQTTIPETLSNPIISLVLVYSQEIVASHSPSINASRSTSFLPDSGMSEPSSIKKNEVQKSNKHDRYCIFRPEKRKY